MSRTRIRRISEIGDGQGSWQLIEEAEVDAGEEILAKLSPGFFLVGGFKLAEEIFGGGEFTCAWRTAEDELVGAVDRRLILDQFFRNELGLFANKGAVHEEERLGGEVGHGAFANDEIGVGGIEDFKKIEHGIAKPGDVNAATLGVEFVVEIILSGVAEGAASALGIEISADEKDGVANAFGLKACAIGPSEKPVFGVARVIC